MLCNPDFLQQIILPWFVLSVIEIWSFQIGMCLNHVIALMSFGSEGNDALGFFGNVGASSTHGAEKFGDGGNQDVLDIQKSLYFWNLLLGVILRQKLLE